MKSLIVEDIIKTSDLIKNRILTVSDKVNFIQQVFTLDDALIALMQNSYDIVFWDVNMPGGTSFDILRKLALNDKINFESIFITGEKESEHIINALKFSAIDYIYKPLEDTQLLEAIEKAFDARKKLIENKQMEVLLNLLGENENNSKKIALSLVKGTIIYLNTEDITFLEADGVITRVFTNDNSIHYASKNLGFYKGFLLELSTFFLISHSVIINSTQIKSFNPKNLTIYFRNGKSTSVARRRAKDFKEFFNKTSSSESLMEKIRSILKL